ncbi:MAG: glycosyltransferase [Bdellovibrionales bacterium]
MNDNKRSVVLFATADWNAPYWTNKQHTAVEFVKRGHQVLYVESVGLRRPGANVKDLSRIFSRLTKLFQMIRKEREGLWVFSPFVLPFAHRNFFVRGFNHLMMALPLKVFCWVKKFNKPIIWTYHPLMLDLIESIEPSKIVYHNVDNLSQAVPGMDSELILCLEEKLIRVSDRIFNTSLTLHDRVSKIASGRSYYFGNVADIEMFSKARRNSDFQKQPDDLERIPEPRVVYLGVLSDFKLNLDLIDKVLQLRPEYNWCFIGEEREGQVDTTLQRIKTRKNAHFLGRKPYSEIPKYLRYMSVATLPTQINDYTKSMFPMKFFEYLAAGLDVISTPLPAIQEHRQKYFEASTVEEFIEALDSTLKLGESRKVEIKDIESYSWTNRMDRMLKALESNQET